MYVEDAAEAMWLAAREPKLFGETFFATGDEHLSVKEIADTIVAVMQRGSVAHIEWPDERRRMEIEHVKFSSARLRKLIKWKPHYDFISGLKKTRDIIGKIKL